MAEIIAGVMILVPRLASYGALLIFAIMVGAIGTHFRFGEYMDAYTSELPSLCFSAALVFARWLFEERRTGAAADDRLSRRLPS